MITPMLCVLILVEYTNCTTNTSLVNQASVVQPISFTIPGIEILYHSPESWEPLTRC